MLGGIRTAERCGKTVPNRDTIRTRIDDLPEGAIFRQEDIAGGDHDLGTDFAALRGHDHIHLFDGYHTGIVETDHLRRLPRRDALMASYAALFDCRLAESGDHLAWRLKLTDFEPINGIRYHSDGAARIMSFYHTHIQILDSPDWAFSSDNDALIARILHDTPERIWGTILKRMCGSATFSADDISAAQVLVNELALKTEGDLSTSADGNRGDAKSTAMVFQRASERLSEIASLS